MITVCFRKGGHPSYDEILNYPPDGVSYEVMKGMSGAEGVKPGFVHKAKRSAFGIYRRLNGNLNAISIRPSADIIFSCGGLMVKSDRPWVTDSESPYALIGHQQWNPDVSKILKRTVEHIEKSKCRILPWTETSKKSAANLFGGHFGKIEDKFEVVYPAMHVDKVGIRRKSPDKVRFLYVSRVFWGKSGHEVLLAFDKISRNFDAELVFISDVPQDIRRKFGGNENIKFMKKMPRERLMGIYRESDVFVLPTLFDTFGFVYLEAMSFSLPVIATDIYSVPEIVREGVNGTLVRPEYNLFNDDLLYRFRSTHELYDHSKKNLQTSLISQLKERMAFMIENERARLKYGAAGRRMVESGRFSIKERNRKLKNVFEALIS